jgi:hypothetical protein
MTPWQTADAIHFTHAAASTACDVDFILEIAGDRYRLTCGLPHQFFEQRRHAREADDMIGLRTDQGRRRHFRKGGVARVLHHGDAAGLLQRRKAGRAVPQHPGEDGANRPGTTAEGRGPEQRVQRRPGVVLARPRSQPQLLALHNEVTLGRRDIDMTSLKLLAIRGELGRERTGLSEDGIERRTELAGQVDRHHNRSGEVTRKLAGKIA